jgi:hypothetical protein
MPAIAPKPDPRQLAIFPVLFDRATELLSVAQVAKELNRSENFVRELFDNQKLLGHSENARQKPGEERAIMRMIPRDCIKLYWAGNANYATTDLLALLQQIAVKRLDRESRLSLRNALTRSLEERA